MKWLEIARMAHATLRCSKIHLKDMDAFFLSRSAQIKVGPQLTLKGSNKRSWGKKIHGKTPTFSSRSSQIFFKSLLPCGHSNKRNERSLVLRSKSFSVAKKKFHATFFGHQYFQKMAQLRLLDTKGCKEDKRTARRVARCIRTDNDKKLRALLMGPDGLHHHHHHHHPASLIDRRRKRTALHLCARHGSVRCLKICLVWFADSVSNSALAMQGDYRGDSALHLALKRCLKERCPGSRRRDALRRRDIVTRILALGFPPQCLDRPNKSGTTCRVLLDGLFGLADESSSTSSCDSNTDGDGGDLWAAKLRDIGQEDYFQSFGKFEAMGAGEAAAAHLLGSGDETYDQWADRILEEYLRRRSRKKPLGAAPESKRPRRVEPPPAGPRGRLLTLPPSSDNNFSTKDHLLSRKKRLLDRLFELKKVTSKDLPFTTASTEDEIVHLLLEGCNKGGSSQDDIKAGVREAVRRWHPDKFMQLMGDKVPDGPDLDRVMKVVTHVSQTLLSYGKG